MVCSKCNILKEIDKFAWKNKALGIRRPFCKDCANAKLSRYYKDNPERYLGYELRRRYGLTLEQYYDLLDMQITNAQSARTPSGCLMWITTMKQEMFEGYFASTAIS